jgi:peptidoglycan DL-endopeptidase LytF
MILVTVKKGDVLEKIAKAHQTSVTALMKANNLSSTQLKIGQVLKVPAKEGSPPVLSAQPSAAMEYYIVKEGDSPWLIATKNHVKVDELLKLNNLDEQKARKLRPGDRLRIR